jgi:hypothetical protein
MRDTAEIVANIFPAPMASKNDLSNDNRESIWIQNNSVILGNISSHQMPTLHHRASNSQLNNLIYPVTPIFTHHILNGIRHLMSLPTGHLLQSLHNTLFATSDVPAWLGLKAMVLAFKIFRPGQSCQ